MVICVANVKANTRFNIASQPYHVNSLFLPRIKLYKLKQMLETLYRDKLILKILE